MYRHRGSFQPNNSDEYDDLSNFDREDGFVDDSYDNDANDVVYDEQFDEYGGNPDFDEEYYEDNTLPHPHRFSRLIRWILKIVAVVLLILFIAYVVLLVWFVLLEPNTYIPVKTQRWVATVLVQRTGKSHAQLYVEVSYMGSGEQKKTVCGNITGDTFSMQEDWIEFAGNQVNGFQWADIKGQFTVTKCRTNNTTGEATFEGGNDTLFTIIHALPAPSWLLGTTTQSFTKQEITSKTFLKYNLFLSTNGKLTYQQIQ